MTYPMVPAKYHGGPLAAPSMIVLHSMEAPEGPNTAENVARYFHTIDHPASAHFCVDENSVVQCVAEDVQAYHAPPANGWALGIEQAGYARETHAQWWDDPESHAMITNAVKLAADLCRRHGIPAIYRNAADMLAGHRTGITTHFEVSQAFHQSTHKDPGPGYPIHEFIWCLAVELAPPPAPAPVAPPPAPAPGPVGTLALGASGDAVTVLQFKLNALSGQPWVDGKYGQATYLAVTLFQRFAHLPETGTADAATQQALDKWLELKKAHG